MAKKNWVEGVLCRDRRNMGGMIIFFPKFKRSDLNCSTGEWAGRRGRIPSSEAPEWTEEEWLAIYNRSDLPRRGRAYECFLEM